MGRSRRKLNSRAAINRIKIDSMPYSTFASGEPIIPWGIDNMYPNRVLDAIKKSPTAQGVLIRLSQFIFGNGILKGGDVVVNRDGETLNDILYQCIWHGYIRLHGYGLHFNFNVFGQISEVFFVNPETIRKNRSLNEAVIGLWALTGGTFFTNQYIYIDIYGLTDPLEGIEAMGINKYRGQINFFSRDLEIYPTSPFDSAIISASYEKEAQIYPYANIKNNFSATNIIKFPTMQMGDGAKAEANEMQDNIDSLHGADSAGQSLVVTVPMSSSGEMKDYKMVESLQPVNVDTLFVNQNKKAEQDILKSNIMPMELLAVQQNNGFSDTAFAAAWDMKNADFEFDRKMIERDFNKWLPKSIFGIDTIELDPQKPRITAQPTKF